VTSGDWLIGAAGFLIGIVLLGLLTSLVVLIDIKVQLTQESSRRPRRRRRGDEEEE
jgi:hypothetical protein